MTVLGCGEGALVFGGALEIEWILDSIHSAPE